jgi:hypothetical protein
MIVSKNNETARVVSGFYQGYRLAGIWNKGVYIPFTKEKKFSTVKGYIVLTDGESPGDGTPVFDGSSVSDAQLIAGLKKVISNYEVVEEEKPFETEVVFNETDVPYTDNEDNEFPFPFFAIEKAALPEGEQIKAYIPDPINGGISLSSSYKITELSVTYNEGTADEKVIEYYVLYSSANVSGDGVILYPKKEA